MTYDPTVSAICRLHLQSYILLTVLLTSLLRKLEGLHYTVESRGLPVSTKYHKAVLAHRTATRYDRLYWHYHDVRISVRLHSVCLFKRVNNRHEQTVSSTIGLLSNSYALVKDIPLPIDAISSNIAVYRHLGLLPYTFLDMEHLQG